MPVLETTLQIQASFIINHLPSGINSEILRQSRSYEISLISQNKYSIGLTINHYLSYELTTTKKVLKIVLLARLRSNPCWAYPLRHRPHRISHTLRSCYGWFRRSITTHQIRHRHTPLGHVYRLQYIFASHCMVHPRPQICLQLTL